MTYSVLINGQQWGRILPSRGLRQGDPLSPFLFLICAEGLSGLIRKATRERSLHGASTVRQGPKISHLIFCRR